MRREEEACNDKVGERVKLEHGGGGTRAVRDLEGSQYRIEESVEIGGGVKSAGTELVVINQKV